MNNMKFELDEFHRNVTDEDLLADLRRVAEMLGKHAVTMEEYNARGRFHSETISRRFHGWLKALARAKLQPTRTSWRIPDEALFENLETIWRSLGRQPRRTDLRKPLSKYSRSVYESRFGGWRQALEAFVESVSARESVDAPEELVRPVVDRTPNNARTPNWRMRFVILQRDGFRCRSCGASPATSQGVLLQVDHIIPWSKGGRTIEENLQTLCEKCNLGKSDLHRDSAAGP